MNLKDEAVKAAPYLDWVESDDPMRPPGTGAYVGAAVGLRQNSAGTVAISNTGPYWFAELHLTRGSYKAPEGEQQIMITIKGADDAKTALKELISVCEVAGSFELGLEAAAAARPEAGGIPWAPTGPGDVRALFTDPK